MKQYLLSIYQPDGPPPPSLDLEKVMREIRTIRQQLLDANCWVFAGGLHAPSTATVVRAKDGNMFTTDGPYIEGKEHLGGFTILKARDLDDALEWARKYATATTLPIEVRPFQDEL